MKITSSKRVVAAFLLGASASAWFGFTRAAQDPSAIKVNRITMVDDKGTVCAELGTDANGRFQFVVMDAKKEVVRIGVIDQGYGISCGKGVQAELVSFPDSATIQVVSREPGRVTSLGSLASTPTGSILSLASRESRPFLIAGCSEFGTAFSLMDTKSKSQLDTSVTANGVLLRYYDRNAQATLPEVNADK